MTEDQTISALSALAHTQRLRLFRALIVAGANGQTPSVLADQLGVARNALSFHLKELANAGLATIEQQGRNLIYRADYDRMNGLLGYLTEHCCQGSACQVSDFPPVSATPVTADKTYNVLFLCTGNSARSILAESLLNELGRGRFHAYSAGSHPKHEIHPVTLATLEQLQLSTQGLRSKSWDEFVRPDAPVFDFIFTVCDNAAGEVCPVWPGHPVSAHWGVPDPAAVQGGTERQHKAFHDVAFMLRRRIELFLALPLPRLDAMSLQRELDDIGEQ